MQKGASLSNDKLDSVRNIAGIRSVTYTLISQMGRVNFWSVFWHLQGGGEIVSTAFCSRFLASLLKDLARVWVRLILEVFISSNVVIIDPEAKGKVQVRHKLECGLL